MSGFAWVTLATNDSYSLGALVLAHSLKQAGTSHQLAVLVTPGVTNAMRKNLADVFNVVEEVNLFDSKDEANLRLLKRPELGVTFTKLHCWRLTQFEKCVFLDADVLVLANSDELFEREEFSAAPDVGWPDCFNSGVFVYRPSLETYNKLVEFALQKGSFDGGDQGLLNAYFSDWAHKDISKHLPFIYNMCSTACYSYLPAFKYYGGNVKIVHFIGPAKPWLQYFDTESRRVHPSPDLQHLQEVLQRWWDIFCSLIHPKLSSDMAPKQAAENLSHSQSHSQTHSHPNHNYSPMHHEHFEEFPNSEVVHQSQESNVYNVWDPWEEYEEKVSQYSNYGTKRNEQRIVPEISTNDYGNSETNCDNHGNFNQINVQEKVPQENYDNYTYQTNHDNVEHRPVVVQQIFNEPIEHREYVEYPVHNKKQETEINSETYKPHTASIVDNRLDNLNKPLTDTILESSSTLETHPQHNFNPDPSTSPQIHCLTESLPHMCDTSAKISQDASLHTKDIHDDDADSTSQSGLAGAFAQFTLGERRSPSQDALENHLRRQAWEVGNIDYMGRDSFDNIWTKICQTLSTTQLESIKDGAVSSENRQLPDVAKEGPEAAVIESPKAPEQSQEAVIQQEETQPEIIAQAVVEPEKEIVSAPISAELVEVPKPQQEASQPTISTEIPTDTIQEETPTDVEPAQIPSQEEVPPPVESTEIPPLVESTEIPQPQSEAPPIEPPAPEVPPITEELIKPDVIPQPEPPKETAIPENIETDIPVAQAELPEPVKEIVQEVPQTEISKPVEPIPVEPIPVAENVEPQEIPSLKEEPKVEVQESIAPVEPQVEKFELFLKEEEVIPATAAKEVTKPEKVEELAVLEPVSPESPKEEKVSSPVPASPEPIKEAAQPPAKLESAESKPAETAESKPAETAESKPAETAEKPIEPKTPETTKVESLPEDVQAEKVSPPEILKEVAPPPVKPKLAKSKPAETAGKLEESKTPESPKVESLPEVVQAEKVSPPETVKEAAPSPVKSKLAKPKPAEIAEKPEESKKPESPKVESLPEGVQVEKVSPPETVKEAAPPPVKPKLAKLKPAETAEKLEGAKTPESSKVESPPEGAQAEASAEVPKSDTKPKEVRKIKKKVKKVPKAEGEAGEGSPKK
ncbi:hypothetical protein Trydic_g5144 [Trypoxylus dichotomus]